MKIKVSKFKSKIGNIYTIKFGRRLARYDDFGDYRHGIQPVAFQTRKEALQYAKKLKKVM